MQDKATPERDDELTFDSVAAVAAFVAEHCRARLEAVYWAAAPGHSRDWIEAWYRTQP
jgi:hypothetical protein